MVGDDVGWQKRDSVETKEEGLLRVKEVIRDLKELRR